MLNLLISLMTTTFARIQSNADMEWKFTRASTWIHYYDDNHAIPVPFNVIPSFYGLKQFFQWIQDCCGEKKLINLVLIHTGFYSPSKSFNCTK